MIVYYCGFNGFGQFPNKKLDDLAIYVPTIFPYDVISISCAWNYIFFRTESESFLSGFINGAKSTIHKLSVPSGNIISRASCSTNKALFITEDGGCWMHRPPDYWKDILQLLKVETNSHLEDSQSDFSKKNVSSSHKIVQACCEDKLNVVLCNLGHVYSIPSNLPIPGRKVIEIACGFEHCLMLTDASTVFSWGSGRRGQLGHEALEDENSPREIEVLSGLQVKGIAAGGWHSVALTNCGDMYVWGWNNSGQLAMPCNEKRDRISCLSTQCHSDDDSKPSSSNLVKEEVNIQKEKITVQAIPTPIMFPPCIEERSIKIAACGNRHTIVLTDDGAAWGCGWNAYGQLGLPEWSIYEELTKIIIPGKEDHKVINVICGSWSTAFFVNSQ